MIEIDVERLRSMGLTPALARDAATFPDPDTATGWRLMRLVEVHRDSVELHDGLQPHGARVLPRLLRSLDDEGTGLAVGDWVFAAHDAHGACWVHERLPPQSHIARRDADGRRHPVVSNVDTALLVMGLDDDFNPRRLERYLILVQGSGVQPVLVLTKADAVPPERLDWARAQLRGRLPAHVELFALNGRRPEAAQALAPWLGAGQTVVLMGSSGAGKSTLTNTLAGAALQDTGAVREHDSRGKHTTTSRSLHRLPGGACVIDTPGLRTLRPDTDEARLALSFEDIATLAPQCRFRDCRHQDEPGCAVRAGVGADRVRNYHKLLREVRRDTLNPLERRQEVAQWKSRGRAAHQRVKLKRGEG